MAFVRRGVRFVRSHIVAGVAIFLFTFLGASAASAAGTVGSGTPASCTDSAFAAALVGGGTVTFNCGPDPHTITLTSTKTPPTGTVTIDGGGLITLSPVTGIRAIDVAASTTFNLQNITIANTDMSAYNSPGALYVVSGGGTVATIKNVTFVNNRAGGQGGAILTMQDMRVINCTFINNSSTGPFGGGGAIESNGGELLVVNSTFSGNSAPLAKGGAIELTGFAYGTVTNSTFAGNSATDGADIAFNTNTSAFPLKVRNSVLASSTTNGCSGPGADPASVSNYTTSSNCTTGFSLVTTGDLALLPVADNGGSTQTIALGTASVARNRGNAAVCAAANPLGPNGEDQRGVKHLDRCDVGSFEADRIVVGTGTPASCTDAAFTTALAAGGTITFNCGSSPHTISLTATKVVPAGTTTIDGGGLITLSPGPGIRAIDVGANTTFGLQNITIANTDMSAYNSPGGVYITSGGGTVSTFKNVTFFNNRAGGQGGAILTMQDMRVINCTFINNSSTGPFGGGGAIESNGGELLVVNSTFSGNSAPLTKGGAIEMSGFAYGTLTNSTFAGNSASDGADIAFNTNASAFKLKVRNSILASSTTIGCSGLGADPTSVTNFTTSSSCTTGFTAATAAQLNLQPLADNGGPTQTIALGTGSVAINAGTASVCSAGQPTGSGGFDQRNVKHSSTCDVGAFEVSATQATTTLLSSSPHPSRIGQSVTLTAVVDSLTGTPSGTVTFFDSASSLGSAAVGMGGIATISTSGLTGGSHSLTAQFVGDTGFADSTSGMRTHNVAMIVPTATAVGTSLTPTVYGQPVTFTATITDTLDGSTTPTGTVHFVIDGGSPTAVSLSGGTAQLVTSSLGVGSHSVVANYAGNTTYQASSGSLSGGQTVNKADTATTVVASVNPSLPGQSVTFTITVASVAPGGGTPSGSVNVTVDGGAPVSRPLVSGQATYTTSSLAAGTREIAATYPANSQYNSSSGSATQHVNTAPTLAVISDQVVTAGNTLHFTAAGSDPDPGDSVTYAISSLTGASIHPTSGVFTWRPTSAQVGAAQVNVIVADTHGATDTVTVNFTVMPSLTAGEFDANDRSDILVRNDSTTNVRIWSMNGAAKTYDALVAASGSYTVVGMGDFDGDVDSDILLRDSLGNIGIWFMSGAVITSGALVGSPGSYSVAGVADFDGDTRDDILLRDSLGNIGIWFMNGSVIVAGGLVGTPGGDLVGLADFNADGRTDMLFRDSSGNVATWLMNGASITGGALLISAPAVKVVGVADLNGDNSSEIIVRDETGWFGMWGTNGLAITAGSAIGTAGNVHLAGNGDYNGDGNADLLLRNADTGALGVWFMNGSTILSGAYVGEAALSVVDVH